MWWGNHFFRAVDCGQLIPGPKAKPKGPPEGRNSSHESCIMFSAQGSWLREDARSFHSSMPKLITLSEAAESVCPKGPGLVVCGLCLECLQFRPAQRLDLHILGPVAPRPNNFIYQLEILGSREKVLISLKSFRILCTGERLRVKSLFIWGLFA